MCDQRAGRAVRHPGLWLLVVVLVGLVNQIFFSVYAFREPQRVAELAHALPSGWFDLAPPPGWLDRLVPRTGLLALTALRVQAGIELPFAMLAYLLVCRWFSRDVFDRALRLRWLASAAWTTTFCLIEMWLPTPDTAQDIGIRVASGLIAPALLGALRARTDDEGELERGEGASLLGSFVLSAAALGGLVLVVYEVILLYNFGRASAAAPGAGALAAVLVLARVRAFSGRPGAGRPGPATGSSVAALGEFLVLFFVPALPIRYGFVVGYGKLSVIAGLVLVLVAVARAGAYRGPHALAAVTGLAVGVFCVGALPVRSTEARLLLAAASFLAAAFAVCWISDRRLRRGASG